ncbi:RNA-binding protein 4.1 [Syngnathus scovelli]|uniref:RNA-binding protein 4.1 n=1 Tax=Syngnathus scovelli TaxID=161590 RepID=UPI0021105D5D|nr:RNA-binding protein 4.1 [Syngnathus scovelli]XP_049595004.1 RNA-binding protein 4.1 [Syngnathus scovelli]
MVKLFIGNLTEETTRDEIEALFTPYGTITECAKYKNYAFVHMDDRKAATKAIRELNLYQLNGRPMNVEPSRGNNQGPVKIHIANVERGFEKELRELFEEYGTVSECAIVKNFAFVHMANSEEAMDAIKGLDNTMFQGQNIHVQLSKSKPAWAMGEEDYGPPPPGRGFYPPHPPHPPRFHPEPPYGGRMSSYPPPPPPPPPPRRPMYPDRGYGEREGYGGGVVDYYEKFRARPYGAPGYDDRRPGAIPPPPPPPPPSVMGRDRVGMGSHEGYDRRPIPPAPYMQRDRSPIRRAPHPPPPAPAAGNGYSYERTRFTPQMKPQQYAAPFPRNNFTQSGPVATPAQPTYTSYPAPGV